MMVIVMMVGGDDNGVLNMVGMVVIVMVMISNDFNIFIPHHLGLQQNMRCHHFPTLEKISTL